jgi:hypothetical protein
VNHSQERPWPIHGTLILLTVGSQTKVAEAGCFRSSPTRGRMALSTVAMSTHSVCGAATTVLQSWQTDTLEKSLSVTCEAASFQVEFGAQFDRLLTKPSAASPIHQRDFVTDRRADTARLLRHIIRVSQSPQIESPLSLKVALWVDEVIRDIRSKAALRLCT